MTPTEILKHEHKIILLVLDAAERTVDSIKTTGEVKVSEIERMLDFFRNFADRCHHAKEEKLLFVKMNDKGMPKESGPIAVMLKEHEFGREKLRAVEAALIQAGQGDMPAKTKIIENLTEYITMLRLHIEREDSILYPMGDKIFTEEDQKSLHEAFDKVENEEMGEGVHEKYHKLAHDLSEHRSD
jgi:hemerythrin-like domain-containing protein